MKYSLTNTLTLTYQPLNDTVITLQKIIIHLIFFLFILLRQYWQVRAKISGLQKLSTSPYNVCWQFLIERWDKRTLSSHWIFSSSLSLSLSSLPESKGNKKKTTWWFGRRRLPMYRHGVILFSMSVSIFLSLEDLFSNRSLQHHHYSYVSGPRDSEIE